MKSTYLSWKGTSNSETKETALRREKTLSMCMYMKIHGPDLCFQSRISQFGEIPAGGNRS